MPDFSLQHIKKSRISSKYVDLLDSCTHFQSLNSNKKEHIEAISVLHDTIVDQSRQLLEPDVISKDDISSFETIIARSLNLQTHLLEYIHGHEIYLDTFGSKCLHFHNVDLTPDPEKISALESRILENFNLSKESLEAIKQANQWLLEDAKTKKKIIEAINTLYQLDINHPELKNNIKRFFSDVFGPIPLCSEQIDLISTGGMIFFCLPFQEKTGVPQAAAVNDLNPADKEKVETFFNRICSFKHHQFAHFPVFGFIRGQDMNPDMIKNIMAHSGLSKENITAELDTLIATLPSQSVDKYLLHDVWGHSWQAGMLNFEHMYREISTYNTSLNQLLTSADSSIACCHNQQFDPKLFETFVTQMIIERIPAAMTPVIAEMLADIVEYKFLDDNPDLKNQMPSSSLFKFKPVKLDFLFEDIFFYYKQTIKTLKKWLKSDSQQNELRDSMMGQGLSLEDSHAAIEQIKSILNTLLGGYFSDVIEYKKISEHEIEINCISRVLLNLIALHGAVIHVYTEQKALDVSQSPLDGLVDLMIFSLGLYFEDNRSENLWKLDEYLSYFFIPLSKQLLELKSS